MKTSIIEKNRSTFKFQTTLFRVAKSDKQLNVYQLINGFTRSDMLMEENVINNKEQNTDLRKLQHRQTWQTKC